MNGMQEVLEKQGECDPSLKHNAPRVKLAYAGRETNVAKAPAGQGSSKTFGSDCPCCGAKLRSQQLRVDLESNTFLFSDRFVHLGSTKAELMSILVAAYPSVASYDSMTSKLWGNSEPEAAYATLKVYISQLRRIFIDAGMALELVNTHSRGYRISIKDGRA